METSREDMSHKISRKIDEHEDKLAMEESQHLRPKSIEWTDEKHSSYLKSMEASFVDQLYGSLDLVGWHSQNDLSKSKSSRQKHANPLGQYKVFQDGCWTKIDFGKDEPRLNKTNESGTVLASPWIKHYKSQGTHQMRVNSNLQGNTTLVKQNQSPASDCGSSRKNYVTEVMDQNFVDEDIEEGNSSSREHSTKRTKISLRAGTSTDQIIQVVPFRVFSMNDDHMRIFWIQRSKSMTFRDCDDTNLSNQERRMELERRAFPYFRTLGVLMNNTVTSRLSAVGFFRII